MIYMKHFSTEKKKFVKGFFVKCEKNTLYHYYLIYEKTVHPNVPNLCGSLIVMCLYRILIVSPINAYRELIGASLGWALKK